MLQDLNYSSSKPEFNFDFGTKPTTDTLEEIKVKLDPNLIVSDFAKAYEQELFRRNPGKAETIGLTSNELDAYIKGIIAIRVEQVNGYTKVWRQAKQLLIPSWIQFVISEIGIFTDVDRGFKVIPSFDYDYDINSMLITSAKLYNFIVDGVTLHKDAFPRSEFGDEDVMSMVVIDDYVKSMVKSAHPISSYVSAFIGAKLEEETAFKILYRVRYDDISFIKSMLMSERSLI